ncbi:hypothetical protein PBY51_015602 [Eleginops maclovinus]|uniref:Uncharacterized protein n=1 Tax=Eleginops maclovinus TaxID=56733 RepID=A0AAN8ARF4_ELEMC|nr:hypothetical protein PBY51_015602 [Eleginops maclovinus]
MWTNRRKGRFCSAQLPADLQNLDQRSGRFITTRRQVITGGIQVMTTNKHQQQRSTASQPGTEVRGHQGGEYGHVFNG